jgi:flavin-dependent dehydrogenase
MITAADVIVVGAGLAGLTAARALADAGADRRTAAAGHRGSPPEPGGQPAAASLLPVTASS